MITLRPSLARGYFDYTWLKTYHTFSFNAYHDPRHIHFQTLRVINQDIIAPETGFPMHSHHDMEIITYPLQGTVTHQDSMGNKTEINAGEIQLMSAGTGVQHSEYNLAKNEILELLQIWIFPDKKGLKPSYQQLRYDQASPTFRLLVSPDGQQGSLKIHQAVKLFNLALPAGKEQHYTMSPEQHAWAQVTQGSLLLNQNKLTAGDGAAVSKEQHLQFQALENCQLLLFDIGAGGYE